MTGGLDARRTPPTAATFAWAVAGVVAFTLYGSFVPFHFRPRPWADAVGRWTAVLANPGIESRSDFVANVLLGGPLGFTLLGALRVDRPGAGKAVAVGLAVWPACVLFAAAVEFGQLFFPGRTSSLSDVIAQGAGSAAGIAAWVVAGPRLTRWARKVWAGPRVGGTAGRLLVAYLALLALVQLLPLDLTLSPAEFYHKLRDQVTYRPFGELATPRAPSNGWRLKTWIELAGLYFPVGLLAAGRSPRLPAPRAVAAGLAVALAMEAGQLFVASRHPSVTDVLVGGGAVALGWVAGRLLVRRRLTAETALVLGQAWAVVLLAAGWLPFDFDGSIAGARLRGLNWVPFAGNFEKDYLNSLEEALTKVLLTAPLGAVAAAAGRGPGRRAVVLAVAAGAGMAAVVEAGQLFLPGRYPGPTDVLFGALGGWLGGWAGRRVRAGGPAGGPGIDGGGRA